MNQRNIDVINICLDTMATFGNEQSKADIKDAKEAFQRVADKQIPKPPEYKVVEKYKTLGKNYWCECGVMFVDFERNGTNYCGNCGQRLKGDE